MRRISGAVFCGSATAAAASVVRCAARVRVKKYDLFGYEVDTNTAPWIEKIKKCRFYDEAGEVLVNMNVSNCPPDLAVENESKFCAMMDLLEEMQHRNKIKPNGESWTWVMRECVKSGQFRLGYCIQRVMEAECKACPADLVAANEANAQKAKAEGKEHPGNLSQQAGLFDVKVE
uniref:Putative ribonucleoprotein p18, mitochondrial n=1 Tax=Trypanosoma vivax (strain Y486) TaxID=1055687 RepID=G0TVE6_TRYVY|nr:putative ribonucleoprotein p18, mitochondrial precursor, fragment [Trypanosoma vivax Y486]